MSEPAVGQLWSSVFGHSEWKHLVRFVMEDDEDICVKIWQRCGIEFCVKLGKSGNETLEMLRQAYVVVKHLAVLQYFNGGGTSKTVTRE